MKKLFLNKYAVESFDWIPEDIQDYLNKIETIKKNPKLASFREPLTINDSIEINKDIINSFMEILKNQIDYIGYELKELSELIRNDEYVKSIKVLTDKLDIFRNLCTFEAVNENKVTIDKNVFKISKYYTLIFGAVYKLCKELQDATYEGIVKSTNPNYSILGITKQILDLLMPFDKLNGKVAWDKRGSVQNLEVVFTTNYKDLLGMSSRSTWTSCQDLRPTKNQFHAALAKQILGSAIEEDVGMIYITNSKQYEGYGEQILYRAVVWMIYNKISNQEGLLIPVLYPNDHYDNIKELLGRKLEEKLNIPVIETATAMQDYITKFKKIHPGPYPDVNLENKSSIDLEALETLGINLKSEFGMSSFANANHIPIYVELMKQLETENSELNVLYTQKQQIYSDFTQENFYDKILKPLVVIFLKQFSFYIERIIDQFRANPVADTPFNTLIKTKLSAHIDDSDLIDRFIYLVAYNIVNEATLFNDLYLYVSSKHPEWMSLHLFKSFINICVEQIFWESKHNIQGV